MEFFIYAIKKMFWRAGFFVAPQMTNFRTAPSNNRIFRCPLNYWIARSNFDCPSFFLLLPYFFGGYFWRFGFSGSLDTNLTLRFSADIINHWCLNSKTDGRSKFRRPRNILKWHSQHENLWKFVQNFFDQLNGYG